YEPFLIARHLVAVAQAFNKFYHAHTVIVDEPVLRGARLALTDAVRAVLRGGLALLGVRSPQRM
ncbi:MAG: arginine--tRNA ligase, partial [Clostridiales bacterium]|nr:arginine--tRNA ligase [Clostridiales bacterium]